MSDFACIIPIWNANREQHDLTVMGLTSIARTLGNPMIIAVDNASTYPQTKTFLDKAPGITLISNKKNNGYGPALNQGLLLAYYNKSIQHFICLNNDIFYTHKNWAEGLLAPLRQGQKVLVGTRLIVNNEWVRVGNQKWIRYLEGWCLAFSRSFLVDVGFFDEDLFPAWAEDVDISWRAERHGYGLVVVPPFGLVHAYGRTGYDGRLPSNEITLRNCDIVKRKYAAGDDKWRGPKEFAKSLTE